jgi:hypothetical protein
VEVVIAACTEELTRLVVVVLWDWGEVEGFNIGLRAA